MALRHRARRFVVVPPQAEGGLWRIGYWAAGAFHALGRTDDETFAKRIADDLESTRI